MHWFSKGTVSSKQEFFSEDALKLAFQRLLLSNVSDALSPTILAAVESAITGEKDELRK